jgi:general secretion pathway protein G
MRQIQFGFTLIELLIVVAIIAILAAIAVPNFLEAQTRAKVSRVKADQRSLATALEAYVIDHNTYPLCNTFQVPGVNSANGHTVPDDMVLERLSTPTAYITNAFLRDPFFTNRVVSVSMTGDLPGTPFDESIQEGPQYTSIFYTAWDPEDRALVPTDAGSNLRLARSWLVGSGGPDRIKIAIGGVLDNFSADDTQLILYDTTNGTISYGDIWRVGGSPGGDSDGSGAYGGGFFQGVQRNQ